MSDDLFKVQIPMTCDCGHEFKVAFIGMEHGDDVTCPECDHTEEIDDDTFFELEEQFRETVEALYEQLGHEPPDDDTVEFIRMHNRIPTPDDLRKCEGYAVPVAGAQFFQAAVAECSVGDSVTLLREIGNPEDENAIVVVAKSGKTIGFIPARNFIQRVVHKEGRGAVAKVFRLQPDDEGRIGLILDATVVDAPIGERAFVARNEAP